MAKAVHFKIHAYGDNGNRPWIHEHYEFDVPPTATVRELLTLARANGAPSWMSDGTVLQEFCVVVPIVEGSERFPRFPGDERPAQPLPGEFLDKNAVACGLRERSSEITFSIYKPRGFGVYG